MSTSTRTAAIAHDPARATVAAAGAVLLAATGIAVVGATPAEASGGGYRVVKSGSCSGSATWKLKAAEDNGRIQIEFEVDSNRAGQTWGARLKRDGNVVWKGSRTTAGRSGSFTVRKIISNSAGNDVIVGRATHGAQVCRGQVTYAR